MVKTSDYSTGGGLIIKYNLTGDRFPAIGPVESSSSKKPEGKPHLFYGAFDAARQAEALWLYFADTLPEIAEQLEDWARGSLPEDQKAALINDAEARSWIKPDGSEPIDIVLGLFGSNQDKPANENQTAPESRFG